MKILILLCSVALLINSCSSPDKYIIRRGEFILAEGFKMSGIDDVKEIASNAIAIDSNALTSWKSPGITQGLFDFTIEILGGKGTRFYFRTAGNNFHDHNNICFHYLSSGSYLTENNKQVASFPDIKAKTNTDNRIKIINDGIKYQLIFNCDTLHKGFTTLPATEYLIIETLPDTRAVLYGIDMIEVYEYELPYFYQ